MKELIREELAMVGGGEGDENSLYGDLGYALGYFIGLVASVNKAVEESGNEMLGAMQYGA